MRKKWQIKPAVTPPEIPELNYPPLVMRLLAQRGLTDAERIQDFLRPEYRQLHDPFLFRQMGQATDRIWKATEAGELIVIYADYDADAITACSVAYLALQKLGARVETYIPDRFTEGYGVNSEAIEKIHARGAKVIITVDCGTNSVAETELCRKLGIDLIITDHHEITGELPPAFALLNPKNPQDQYPFLFLTGVGVVYKLVQGLFSRQDKLADRQIPPGWEKWLLDLVAIGTVADCQSLQGENRILVSFGLAVLAKSRWPGLRSLLEAAQVKNLKYNTFLLGFVIAPRINAAGRIKHADAAFKLLVADDAASAQAYAKELNRLNTHRQMLTEQILSEARAQAELIAKNKVIMVAGNNWPKGVVGLVAGRLCEEYGRPVLVMDKGEQWATGSARSIPQFDIVKALTHSRSLLEKYGGHTQAAGFTLKSENIPVLYRQLLEYAETLDEADLEAVLELDAEMLPTDLNWDVHDILEKLEPFGVGNMRPRFAGHGFKLVDYRLVGAEGLHLKLRLAWGDKIVEAIAFRQGFLAGKLGPDAVLDVAFELEANEWNNQRDLQLKIIDFDIV